MDENKLRFGVGVLVISAIGIGVILTFLFGAFPSVLNREYTISVAFPSAEGVGLNTPVTRDGVRIGRVADIQLRDDPMGGVLITLSMDADKPLTHRYLPRIGRGNLVTGDANLEFFQATDAELPQPLAADTTLVTAPYTDQEFFKYGKVTRSLFDTQSGIQDTFESIRAAGASIALAGENVNLLVEDVRKVLGGSDQQVEAVAQEAVKALEEFQGAMTDIRKIVGNPKLQQGLEASMLQIPAVLTNVQKTLDEGQKTLESIGKAGDQFTRVGIAAEETVITAKQAVQRTEVSLGNTVRNAEKTFANLEQFTRPFAKQGDQFAGELLTTLTSLNRTLTEVEQFGKTLNNSDGSLKRFLEDDEMYFQIRRTVENIEHATARIRPILDDVRVFSDKIARDPRQLGVRGAITKRPSGAGLK